MGLVDSIREAYDDMRSQWEREVLNPLIKQLMQQQGIAAFQTQYMPQEQLEVKKREELKKLLTGEELQNTLENGLKLLYEGFISRFCIRELQEINQEFEKGIENIVLYYSKVEEAKGEMPTLQQIMNLSYKTMDEAYHYGISLYEADQLQDAADLFILLTLFNFSKHNIWVALGLAEKRLGHYELATNAFSMAMLTNSAAPLPYLYSSDCFISLGKKQQAEKCLQVAFALLKNYPEGENSSLLSYANTLTNRF